MVFSFLASIFSDCLAASGLVTVASSFLDYFNDSLAAASLFDVFLYQLLKRLKIDYVLNLEILGTYPCIINPCARSNFQQH